MNTYVYKNKGNVATFGLNAATLSRVIMPTSRHSIRWKFQRRDVPESHLSQRRDVGIQRHNVPKNVEI